MSKKITLFERGEKVHLRPPLLMAALKVTQFCSSTIGSASCNHMPKPSSIKRRSHMMNELRNWRMHNCSWMATYRLAMVGAGDMPMAIPTTVWWEDHRSASYCFAWQGWELRWEYQTSSAEISCRWWDAWETQRCHQCIFGCQFWCTLRCHRRWRCLHLEVWWTYQFQPWKWMSLGCKWLVLLQLAEAFHQPIVPKRAAS